MYVVQTTVYPTGRRSEPRYFQGEDELTTSWTAQLEKAKLFATKRAAEGVTIRLGGVVKDYKRLIEELLT